MYCLHYRADNSDADTPVNPHQSCNVYFSSKKPPLFLKSLIEKAALKHRSTKVTWRSKFRNLLSTNCAKRERFTGQKKVVFCKKLKMKCKIILNDEESRKIQSKAKLKNNLVSCQFKSISPSRPTVPAWHRKNKFSRILL